MDDVKILIYFQGIYRVSGVKTKVEALSQVNEHFIRYGDDDLNDSKIYKQNNYILCIIFYCP